jgi:indolepyruvate ferredoxin oxidoreductase, beta subunit
MTKSIILVGVGGQGTITASKLLTLGLMEAGFDVKMSEIHGMSQRGGSVSSQVRYGEKVHSAVIEKGGADILVAFEKIEAMRFISYLKKDGKIVVNDYKMDSVMTIIGAQDYPTGVLEELREKANVLTIKAGELAEKLGNTKVMNIILLGALIKSMELDNIDWNLIIEQNLKPKFVELNKEALKIGMDMAV